MQWITAACIWLQFAQADGETAVTALNNKILKPVQVALMILLHTFTTGVPMLLVYVMPTL